MNKSSSLIGLCSISTLLLAAAAPSAAHAEASLRRAGWCGTRVIPDVPRAAPREPWLLNRPTKLYLNKNGVTVQLGRGGTDATINNVNYRYFANSEGGSMTIPALDTSKYNWATLKSCVAARFSDFAIEVVESEPPANERYIEVVVGGESTDVRYQSGSILGIAPADGLASSSCDMTVHGFAFALSEEHDFMIDQIGLATTNRELCNTVAHEAGHALGLNHEQLHADLMSYDFAPNMKEFIDQNTTCGEYDTDMNQPVQNYCCEGPTMNSWRRLEYVVGLRPSESTPPQVSITAPGNGETVPRGFLVRATATDNDSVSYVTLFIDGNQVAQDPTPDGTTYVMSAPTSLGAGPHTVTAEATDRSGNVARDEIQITVTLACDCSSDYECIEGECKLRGGRACTDGAQCAGELCANGPDGQFCTETCDLNNDACPQGMTCTAIGGSQFICTPNGQPLEGEGGDSGGCGCQVGGRDQGLAGGAFGLGALGVGLAFFLQRRRRRRN